MIGYVLMHRDILDWEWYQSPNVSRLYFHLILKVNFKDKKWQGQLIKRGQLITSLSHLGNDLMLSDQAIRTALNKLAEGGYIKVEATNRFTLVTLVNYDKFQSAKTDANKPNNTQRTNEQQTNNNQITTTKESNKGNKVNKETIELRCKKFKKQIFALSQYDSKILNSFYDYWSELNKDETKMRFEDDKFFEIEKRLKKWKANERSPKVTPKDNPKFITNR